MRLLCKILDLEPNQDREGKPVCHVTIKLFDTQRNRATVVAALKEEHLQKGLNRTFESIQGRPVLLSLEQMLSERKEIIWYFPQNPNPELFNALGFDADLVDASTGEIKDPKAFHSGGDSAKPSAAKSALFDPLKKSG
jgi:hypothetical protein